MFLMIVVLLLLILSIALSGCRTIEVTKEVPVITEKVTERDHVDIVRDTLMMKLSSSVGIIPSTSIRCL